MFDTFSGSLLRHSAVGHALHQAPRRANLVAGLEMDTQMYDPPPDSEMYDVVAIGEALSYDDEGPQ